MLSFGNILLIHQKVNQKQNTVHAVECCFCQLTQRDVHKFSVLSKEVFRGCLNSDAVLFSVLETGQEVALSGDIAEL